VLEAKVPVTVMGLDVPLYDNEIDGLEVKVTEVNTEPPVSQEKGIDTVVVFVTETVPIVGACGFVEGVTADDVLEFNDVPLALVAVTL